MFDRGKESVLEALGRKWTVARFGPSILEKFCGWIREQIGNPFAGLKDIIEHIPTHVADKLIQEAKDTRDALATLDYDDPLFRKFLGSTGDPETGEPEVKPKIRAFLFLFHLLLQKHQPGTDLDTAFDIANEVGMVKAKEVADKAVGRMEGNAASPAPLVVG